MYSAMLARADWLRKHPTEDHVAAAIRLDPGNSYGYTLRAELLEQSGQFAQAEQSWREALGHNPNDAEAWIRTGMLVERRGAIGESERCLIKAAGASKTWFPRWSLVNFYQRHGRNDDLYRWARLAFERASDDVAGLFLLLDHTGASPDFVLNRLLPPNRAVMSAWIRYLYSQPESLEPAAMRLVALIPNSAPGWPGTDLDWRGRRSFPCEEKERQVLLGAVDRMLGSGAGLAASRLWNSLRDREILAGDRWTPQTPVINAGFRSRSYRVGLDWRFPSVPGTNLRPLPEYGEMAVGLDGHQPENADLVLEFVFLPAGQAYNIVMESRTDGLNAENGLEWQVRNRTGAMVAAAAVRPSDDWIRTESELPAAREDRVVALVLNCRRRIGAMRAEGEIRFRRVSLEVSH